MDQFQQNGNQYDFIVSSGSPKKPLMPSLGGQSSFTQKLIFIVGGAIILIIIMWIVGSILGGGGNTAELTKLVQQQEEIARVASLGNEATRADIRNSAATTKFSLASQQRQWLQLLANQGTKVSDEQQQALQNAAADQQLEQAKSNNAFDKTYATIMHTYLNDYATTVQTAFNKAGSNDERELLQSHFQQIKLLQEQLPKT